MSKSASTHPKTDRPIFVKMLILKLVVIIDHQGTPRQLMLRPGDGRPLLHQDVDGDLKKAFGERVVDDVVSAELAYAALLPLGRRNTIEH